MNRNILFVGALMMVLTGTYCGTVSDVSVGLGMIWIGLAVKT